MVRFSCFLTWPYRVTCRGLFVPTVSLFILVVNLSTRTRHPRALRLRTCTPPACCASNRARWTIETPLFSSVLGLVPAAASYNLAKAVPAALSRTPRRPLAWRPALAPPLRSAAPLPHPSVFRSIARQATPPASSRRPEASRPATCTHPTVSALKLISRPGRRSVPIAHAAG